MSNFVASFETIKACWAGIIPRLIHCDTAERLKPHSQATLEGPPKAIRSSFISLIDPPCKCFRDHGKFTKCNFYAQGFWIGESFFSWAFIVGLGKHSRANRHMVRLQAFFRSFVNGRYKWTLYFDCSILEKNHLYRYTSYIEWIRLKQKWERKFIYGE
jgi:hypothetical protein